MRSTEDNKETESLPSREEVEKTYKQDNREELYEDYIDRIIQERIRKYREIK